MDHILCKIETHDRQINPFNTRRHIETSISNSHTMPTIRLSHTSQVSDMFATVEPGVYMRRKVEISSAVLEVMHDVEIYDSPYMRPKGEAPFTVTPGPDFQHSSSPDIIHDHKFRDDHIYDPFIPSSPFPSRSIEEVPLSSTPCLSNEHSSTASESYAICLPTPSQEVITTISADVCDAADIHQEVVLRRARLAHWTADSPIGDSVSCISSEDNFSTSYDDGDSYSSHSKHSCERLRDSIAIVIDSSTLCNEDSNSLKRRRQDSWKSDDSTNAGLSGAETEINTSSLDASEIGLSPTTFSATHRTLMPPHKKLKRVSLDATHALQGVNPASIRRAASLASSECSSLNLQKSRHATTSKAPLVTVLPIIAPPDYSFIPRAPLTSDDAAEARLRRLLVKEKTIRLQDGFSSGLSSSPISHDDNNSIYGIENKFWRKVTNWLMTVLPSKKNRSSDLYDHLFQSQDTRFHAVYIFIRYFKRVGEGMPSASKSETQFARVGRQRITWDIAVSCLALAVKFQKDFLRPLYPVYISEFLALAPHPMSYSDFEAAQRDVLEALEYQINTITPDAILEELRLSLSTLRHLLSFDSAWIAAKEHAWSLLMTASQDPSVVHFPVSILTAAALIEGSIDSLIARDVHKAAATGKDITQLDEVTASNQAHQAVRGLMKDFQDILSVSHTDLCECQHWLSLI